MSRCFEVDSQLWFQNFRSFQTCLQKMHEVKDVWGVGAWFHCFHVLQFIFFGDFFVDTSLCPLSDEGAF